MRLTPKMRELLAELVDNRRTGRGAERAMGGLYIRRYSRWGRTAEALASRGLACIDQRMLGADAQDHWVATDEGMALCD